jgi:5'-nucleotidase
MVPRPTTPARRTIVVRGAALGALAVLWWALGSATTLPAPGVTTISIVGTTDLHGRVFTEHGRGGLTLFGGFVKNLRAARAADGGAVLLLDAGDTFQGGIESNLSEGGLVVDAYNALGYTALAVGNHDFEFGALDAARPGFPEAGDPQGALKAAAARARFPFLAANLLDDAMGTLIDWPNVQPSVLIETAGITVGLVGVMTFDALTKTLAANVGGLATGPLVPAIARQATRLRADGAHLVIVVSHAGGRCEGFDDPADLSSCDDAGEIFDVARRLPAGLVDVIVAGHTHGNVAHTVAGVPIVQAGSGGHAFGRVDVTIDRATRRVTGTRLFAPREICEREEPTTARCNPPSGGVAPRYEGQAVSADPAAEAAMAPGLSRVREIRAAPLGVTLDTPVSRTPHPESAIANLFADALRAGTPGAEAAVSYGAGPGGLRADLPAGPLLAGALYDVFPFDNRVERVTLTGAQVRSILIDQLRRRRGRVTGLSGLRAEVSCVRDEIDVHVVRDSGRAIGSTERILIATPESFAARALGAPALLTAVEGAAPPLTSRPLVRDVVAHWLTSRANPLRQEEFFNPASPRWRFAAGATLCGNLASG